MRLAVLSDIHGNHLALEACLVEAERRRAEGFLFLGDYVTDHPGSRQVLDTLYRLRKDAPCRFIRGNREGYMIQYRKEGGAGWRDGSAQGSLLAAYEALTGADIDWFESLPIRLRAEFPGCPALLLCHGSPENVRDAMAPGSVKTAELLSRMEENWLIKGHSHRQTFFREGEKTVINPGAIGVALGESLLPDRRKQGPGRAQMAMLSGGENGWEPEFLTVPYDVEKAIGELETSGLTRRAPVWAAMLRHNLLTGENPFVALPTRAQELYRLASGREVSWDGVPEEYWQKAAEEFGVI